MVLQIDEKIYSISFESFGREGVFVPESGEPRIGRKLMHLLAEDFV